MAPWIFKIITIVSLLKLIHFLWTSTELQTSNPFLFTDSKFNVIDSDHVIYENPIQKDQCRNALIYKENVNISKLVKGNNDIVWSREYLGFQKHFARLHHQSEIRFPIKHNLEFNESLPIYYKIPKSASSSTIGNLKMFIGDKFETKSRFYNMKFDDEYQVIHTKCGFTFVRNPIHRFISGYYTINKALYNRDKMNSFTKNISNRFDRLIDAGFNFIYKLNEPDRLITFVQDMINNPYLFTTINPMDHIRSQVSTLYNTFFGSDIQFIGKVEYFDKHWKLLINHCEWFKQELQDNTNFTNITIKHAMNGFGSPNNLKYNMNEYENVMMNEKYYNKTLSPAYYIITKNETLYNILIDYFWQDFICFDYKPDFNQFKDYVNQHS